MADTSIGTASMKLTLDTSDYTIAVERAKQQQAGLGTVAEQEAKKMTAAQRNTVASLERQATRIGLTREQWLQYKVITQTTGETQAQLLAKINANTAAVEKQGGAVAKAGTQFNKYGLSVKQQAAAMRQVPAQMTDIFVSLQGGQNPLTVLLQQGGQLKDVFGGVVPAARALGGQLMALANPYTLAAAGAAVVGAAWLGAEQRMNGFTSALVMSGQQGRVTAEDLNAIAMSLDNVSGVTGRQAAAALTLVVANGRIAASQYELVTQAAVMMQDATGKAVSETVEEYAELARDPVSAVLRLNESEKFLTTSVYDRIRAMQEAGDIEGAAALATETRAAAQIARAQEVVASLGFLSGAWFDVKNATGEAWDAAVNYFNSLGTEADGAVTKIARVAMEYRKLPILGGMIDAAGVLAASTPMGTLVARGYNRRNAAKASAAAAGAGAGDDDTAVDSTAQRQLDALLAGNRSREERQTLEERQIVNLHKQLGISENDKRVQDALAVSRQRYKESLPKDSGAGAARSLANAEASATIQAIKNQETVTRGEIANTTKVLQAQYGARQVSASDYYDQQRQLTERDFAAQEQSLSAQIAYLNSRNVAGKDSVNTSKQAAELEAQLAKLRADSATQLTILGIQEEGLAEKRKRGIDSYVESLQTANQAAQQSANAQLARLILGEREAEQQEKLAAITEDTAEKMRQLAREYAETGDADAHRQKTDALREAMSERVRIVQDGYARMREFEGDWLKGFQGGMNQWMEGARNVAEQTNALTQRSLNGIVDSMTATATTGKGAWREMLVDIGTEITRFMMKQAVLSFLKMFAGMWAGGFSGSQGESAGSLADLQGSSWGFAKGGAFPSAHPSLSAYSGTVVNKPTPFYFAKGAGVMGEAGAEGIFPLQRGSDGKLGVKAMGAGGGAPVYVTTNVTVAADGSASASTHTVGEQATAYKQFAQDMSSIAQKEIVRAQMPGGSLWKARN